MTRRLALTKGASAHAGLLHDLADARLARHRWQARGGGFARKRHRLNGGEATSPREKAVGRNSGDR
jgi:hypothetical protein